MRQTIDREQEKMWESIETLSTIDEEQATVVFKLAVEKSLREMDSYTPAVSAMPFTLPKRETLHEMRKIDRSIKQALMERDNEKAYAFLVDYIDLLSRTTGKDPIQVQKQLISSILAKRSLRRRGQLSKQAHLTKSQIKTDLDSLFYTTTEVAKKIGLSDQTIRRLCEKGKFPKAYKTDGGHWRIPKTSFITTDEQDERANQILGKIDAKNRAAGYVDEFDL